MHNHKSAKQWLSQNLPTTGMYNGVCVVSTVESIDLVLGIMHFAPSTFKYISSPSDSCFHLKAVEILNQLFDKNLANSFKLDKITHDIIPIIFPKYRKRWCMFQSFLKK